MEEAGNNPRVPCCLEKAGMKKPIRIRRSPWLKPDVIKYIESLIDIDSEVLEAGAGGSTFWFATRVRRVLSYENDRNWYEVMNAQIIKDGLKNIELIFDKKYPKEGIRRPGESFDLIFIDGRGRVRSTTTAYLFLKSGGHLVFDDSNRKRYGTAIDFLDEIGWRRVAEFSGDEGTLIWRKPQ